MSTPNSERWPNVHSAPIGTQAADITLPVAYFRKRSRLKAARLMDIAGIVAHASNYVIITLQDSGATPKVYASYDSRSGAQGSIAALGADLMVLGGGSVLGGTSGATATTVLGDSTNPEVDVPAGSNLVLKIDCNGTVTTTGAVLSLESYPL